MTKRSLASFRAGSWLSALLLAGSALAGASCAPVCRWAEGACIDLRIEGAGSYSSYALEWRYGIPVEPQAALRRGATESGGELPRTFRVLPPPGVTAENVRSIGVLGLSADGSEQAGGSIELSLSPGEQPTKILPLGLRVSRHDIALLASSAHVISGDFNKDTAIDLAVVGTPSGAMASATSGGILSVLYGVGDGSYQPAKTFDIPTHASAIVAADVDGDARLDLLTTGAGDSFSLLSNTVTGQFGSRTSILSTTGALSGECQSGSDPHSLAVADFNGDGFVDIAATLRLRPCVSLLLGTSKTSFVPKDVAPRPTPVVAGDSLTKLAVADFNEDGFPDVAVIRTTEGLGNIAVLLSGDKENGFTISSIFTAGNEPTGIIADDFNGDKRADLAVVSARSSSLQVFLNTGFVSGMFGGSTGSVSSRPADYEYRFGLPGYGPTCITSGDINTDGILDVVVCDSALPTIGVMLGRSGGGFDPPIRLAVDRQPSAVVIAQLDGKGQQDLAVVHAGSNQLSILLNRTN